MNKILIAISVIAAITACNLDNRNKSKALKGKWLVTEYRYEWGDTSKLDKADIAYMRSFADLYNDALKKEPEGFSITHNDSTYLWETPGRKSTGKWELLADDSTIVYYPADTGIKVTKKIVRSVSKKELQIVDASRNLLIYHTKVD